MGRSWCESVYDSHKHFTYMLYTSPNPFLTSQHRAIYHFLATRGQIINGYNVISTVTLYHKLSKPSQRKPPKKDTAHSHICTPHFIAYFPIYIPAQTLNIF